MCCIWNEKNIWPIEQYAVNFYGFIKLHNDEYWNIHTTVQKNKVDIFGCFNSSNDENQIYLSVFFSKVLKYGYILVVC